MQIVGISRVEKSPRLMRIYFWITRVKVKHRVFGRIKGKTDEEKKMYIKETVSTLCVLLDQLSLNGLGYKGVTFDGVLTFVLNKYKNVKFRYKDWTEFSLDKQFNEEQGRHFMTELYSELEYALGAKKK